MTREMGPATLSQLRSADLDAAFALSAAERWNQTKADWARLLALDPLGCFAARIDGQLIGTVTAMTYGSGLAWIGMMVVALEARGGGIGKALMQHAIRHLTKVGVRTIKLDATPAGFPLYESLGFRVELEVTRMQATALATDPAVSRATALATCDLDGMATRDRRAFGIARQRVLDSLTRADDAARACTTRNDAVLAYGLSRPGRLATYIGPLIAGTRRSALTVLDALLARHAGQTVCLDVPEGGLLDRASLSERGFRAVRALSRMAYGARSAAAIGREVCASAGPELG